MPATAIKLKHNADAEQDDDAEERRLKVRHGIREQLAEIELIRRRVEDKKSALDKLDSKKADANRRCDEVAMPLMEELGQVEQRIAQCLADRTSVDPADEQRRAEIAILVQAAVEVKAREIETIERVQFVVQQEYDALRSQLKEETTTRNRLMQPGVARPDLLQEKIVADFVRDQCYRPFEDAVGRNLESFRSDLKAFERNRDQRGIDRTQPAVQHWRAIHQRASKLLADASKYSNDLYEKMINE